MAYIELGKLGTILKRSWLWGIDRPALVSFYRSDYHGDPNTELDDAVRKTVLKKTGKNLTGPIRLLTHLRYFGYCFNPVSFYYCFDKNDKEVELIMAEVTNTPWNERHSYIINKRSNIDSGLSHLTADLEKKLHVSPFWGMDHQYEWIFAQPEEKVFVNMKNFNQYQKVFDVTLILKRKSFTKKNLIKIVSRFPFITAVIVFRIHWQAFKLWIKKAPFFLHPDKIKLNEGN